MHIADGNGITSKVHHKLAVAQYSYDISFLSCHDSCQNTELHVFPCKFHKRITKESFQKFLDGQDEYHLDPANDYEELALEENVALADFRRKKLVQTGDRGRNGNLQYLTIDEAAFMAKVSRSMINVWYTKGYFPVVKIRNHVRIKRKEFEAWLEKRNTERGC